MKKITLLGMALLAMVALTISGCAGTMYSKETKLSNGAILVQHGRTGASGTDNSGFLYIPEPASAPIAAPVVKPKKVLLERTYTKSSTSWSNCPDRTPNRNAKNVKRLEETEAWTEEVLSAEQISPAIVQTASTQPVLSGFGTNASTVNASLGSLFVAGGMIGGAALLRPDRTNINQTGGGANVGPITTKAEAAAAAAQTQTQDQLLKNKVGVGIDIDN